MGAERAKCLAFTDTGAMGAELAKCLGGFLPTLLADQEGDVAESSFLASELKQLDNIFTWPLS